MSLADTEYKSVASYFSKNGREKKLDQFFHVKVLFDFMEGRDISVISYIIHNRDKYINHNYFDIRSKMKQFELVPLDRIKYGSLYELICDVSDEDEIDTMLFESIGSIAKLVDFAIKEKNKPLLICIIRHNEQNHDS